MRKPLGLLAELPRYLLHPALKQSTLSPALKSANSSHCFGSRAHLSNTARSTSSAGRERPYFTGVASKMAPQVQVKVPKGTRDWIGADMDLRDAIFATIGDVFRKHGGTPLDTPVFEIKDILTNKYGEDSKLIYDLADQGGEICSLRYDLTLPLARYLAQNPQTQQIKRYQIGKVYRRDQPSVHQGRMREFFQCDFDIAGEFDPMIPDAELVVIISEVFQALGLDVVVKINHRKILDGLFTACGVPDDKIRTASSAVDKLDKTPWEAVRKELVEEKNIPEEVADRIWEYVRHKGPGTTALLRGDAAAVGNESVRMGLDDVDLLFRYLDAFGVPETRVSFDLSLARGLDYYTGLIFEVIVDAKNNPTGVGSIAGGGRYDNLVGMLGRRQIPCIGVSFGVDRIFTILNAQKGGKLGASRKTDVFVMAFGPPGFTGMLPERMAVAKLLWDAGIKTEFSAKVRPKLPQQFKAAEAAGAPLAVILGEEELAAGNVKVKVMGSTDPEEKEGRLVPRGDLAAEIKKRLAAT